MEWTYVCPIRLHRKFDGVHQSDIGRTSPTVPDMVGEGSVLTEQGWLTSDVHHENALEGLAANSALPGRLRARIVVTADDELSEILA